MKTAVLTMMDLLQERGFTREQAYVICSVAVDLRISNVVDVPNYVIASLVMPTVIVLAGGPPLADPARRALHSGHPGEAPAGRRRTPGGPGKMLRSA